MEGEAELPVVIAGAGPAGAGLALLFASRGIPVTLVERQHDFTREFRGEAMSPGGLDALAAIGVDIEKGVVPHAQPTRIDVFSEGRRVFGFDLDELPGRCPQMVSQSHLLEHIAALAAGYPGFELLRGASVRELLRDETGRVSGVCVHDDAGERDIQARLVVGADGRSSIVRRHGAFAASERVTPLDVVWTRFPWPAHWKNGKPAQGHVADGHLMIVLPAPEGGLQIAWIIAKGTYGDVRKRGVEEWVRELAHHAGGDLEQHLLANAHNLVKPFLLRAETDRVTGWSKPGVLVIGDAAHTMSPVGGQGINVALRDAIVAANHLVPVLRSGGDARAIDEAASRIEPERGPEIDLIQSIAAQPPKVVLGRSLLPRLARRVLPLLVGLAPVRARAARIASLFLYGVTEVKLEV
jgi:2-polyprenyl-6-methoxyphenol hydroxylase-like FAD-dependent oxidoreductase